jgi:formylglycine-generating enzyme required for sulfatase activity
MRGVARTGTNSANCWRGGEESPQKVTDVGLYTNSDSPFGTFDQGGNVWEWNEESFSGGSNRGLRGGSWSTSAFGLAASYRNPAIGWVTREEGQVGFRVAMIPEPGTGLLFAAGLVGLAAAGRRRLLH